MRIEELRAKILVGVADAPAPFPLTSPPSCELKVSHVGLLVELVLDALGCWVDANGVVRMPPHGTSPNRRLGDEASRP